MLQVKKDFLKTYNGTDELRLLREMLIKGYLNLDREFYHRIIDSDKEKIGVNVVTAHRALVWNLQPHGYEVRVLDATMDDHNQGMLLSNLLVAFLALEEDKWKF